MFRSEPGIATRSTGKFRIRLQRKDDNQAYACGRRHKELGPARAEAKKLFKTHAAVYCEISDGTRMVWCKIYVEKSA